VQAERLGSEELGLEWVGPEELGPELAGLKLEGPEVLRRELLRRELVGLEALRPEELGLEVKPEVLRVRSPEHLPTARGPRPGHRESLRSSQDLRRDIRDRYRRCSLLDKDPRPPRCAAAGGLLGFPREASF